MNTFKFVDKIIFGSILYYIKFKISKLCQINSIIEKFSNETW